LDGVDCSSSPQPAVQQLLQYTFLILQTMLTITWRLKTLLRACDVCNSRQIHCLLIVTVSMNLITCH
jgi:hypothetical protein